MNFYETETSVLAPSSFKGAGQPKGIRLVEYRLPPVYMGARLAGVRYETKFHAFASRRWGVSYRTFTSQAFQFTDVGSGEPRRAIPDGLLDRGSDIVLFECKLKHHVAAYFQLKELYAPLIAQYYEKPVYCVEVCKQYDPGIGFPPHDTLLINDIDTFRSNKVGVLWWKP